MIMLTKSAQISIKILLIHRCKGFLLGCCLIIKLVHDLSIQVILLSINYSHKFLEKKRKRYSNFDEHKLILNALDRN